MRRLFAGASKDGSDASVCCRCAAQEIVTGRAQADDVDAVAGVQSPPLTRRQASSDWRISVTGRRALMRAGMAVSAAIARTVRGTTASSCQTGGFAVESPTALSRAMPAGMPRMAPARAGSTCAAERPALTCWGVAPSARASADECLASRAVAQVMKIALTAACGERDRYQQQHPV